MRKESKAGRKGRECISNRHTIAWNVVILRASEEDARRISAEISMPPAIG